MLIKVTLGEVGQRTTYSRNKPSNKLDIGKENIIKQLHC